VSKFAVLTAKWSQDLGTYIARIDGKTMIIELDETGKSSAKAARSAPEAQTESVKPLKTRKRAKSLSEPDKAKAVALIAGGAALDAVAKAIPGITRNIYAALKRKSKRIPRPLHRRRNRRRPRTQSARVR